MNIDDAGLSHRTNVLLAREHRLFASMVASLVSTAKGEVATPELTTDLLLHALDSKEPGRAYAAAFLIGRCRASDADRRLTQRLEELLDQSPSHEGAPEADVKIEAAMSLVLRGEIERGREALKSLLGSPQPLGDQYKAAFYLAQMGDTSGYPALVRTLHGEIPHYRLMALRHAIAFAPFQGETVDGLEIDVRELLEGGLADPDEMVRREVPLYLEELNMYRSDDVATDPENDES